MMNKVFLAAVAALVCCGPMQSLWAKQEAKSLEVKSGDETRKLHYWQFLPKGYGEDKDKKWPLILFLHGAGERGDNLDAVKKHGPPKIVESNDNFEFIVLSPQCPMGTGWKSAELTQLLDAAVKSLAVDEKRIYLNGLSMGGAGTWNLAAETPDRFAAIVPICGRGNPADVEKLKHIPTWVFIGAKDNAQLVEGNNKLVEELKKAGGNPKYTVYPDAGHDSWTATYDNPELYKWLLEQKKK
jgi:predicted peptidase